MIEDLIRSWDGEYVVMRYDRAADAWLFIAIHSTAIGNASGGTRMKLYDTPSDGLRDAQRLAAGMTYKWAAVEFAQGGGKGVIALSRPLDDGERDRVLESYGSLVESLHGEFSTGADLGVGPELVEVIGRRTGYVHGLRGGGDPGPWTALGVFTAIEAAVEEALGSSELRGRTVLVQGVGDVGLPLCQRLAGAGVRLKVADTDAGREAAVVGQYGAEVVDAESVYAEPCDVFAPCALGGVLNAVTVSELDCRAVAGSANNQLATAEDAERLHRRGILYSPDFISNAGGAVALCGLETHGLSEHQVTDKILGIRGTLGAIFREARERDESPLQAAERRARRVLEQGLA